MSEAAASAAAEEERKDVPPRTDNEGGEGEEEDGAEEYKAMADAFKNDGNAAFKAGKFQEAIDHYTRGVDIDPDNHLLYSNRSAAFIKVNERGKALKDAEKLMEMKPDWPKSYNRKAAAQHALTRYQAAMETYLEGIRLFPDDQSLKSGLKDVEKDYEKDKEMRFEKAKIERGQMEEKKKKEAAEKQKNATAAAARKKQEEEEKAKRPKDELADFFSDLGGGGGKGDANDTMNGANVKREVVKQLKEDYAKADLGTSEEQIKRLLQPNYAWKNLNPYDVLQLGTDATEDDVKLRYRKLSTLVHPDKCLHIEQAREAFEEVKKAYNELIEEERRNWCTDLIEQTKKRTLKDRKVKLGKGVTLAQLGPEDEAIKKAIMKEFAEVEMRRRNAEKHQQAHAQYSQQQEDEKKKKMRQEMEFDKKWTDEERREGRIDNWRDFQKGPVAKRTRVQAWTVEQNVKDKPKYGQFEKEEWKKSWK